MIPMTVGVTHDVGFASFEVMLWFATHTER